MPLGTAVDLGPDYIVLDGDPAPSLKGGTAALPLFGPCLLWPNGRPSHALTSMFHLWSEALDRGDSVRVLFLDYPKAFDRMGHTFAAHTYFYCEMDLLVLLPTQTKNQVERKSIRLDHT